MKYTDRVALTVLCGMLKDLAMNAKGEVFLKDYLPNMNDRREIFKAVLGSAYNPEDNDYDDFDQIDEYMLLQYFIGLLQKDAK